MLEKIEVVYGSNASAAWLNMLIKVMFYAHHEVHPRGLAVRELEHHTVTVDMNYPLVLVPERKLSPQFACAEALWILAGDNRVEPLAKHAPQIRQFSDDGEILAGAYGPGVVAQLDYVVDKLLEDRDTRQAVLTMWKPNPKPSKDIPCTIGLVFTIRGGLLHCHAFMRSSDIWLGLPYDIFSFSMIAANVACRHNSAIREAKRHGLAFIELGRLTLTAVSSHLYEKNFADARRCFELIGITPTQRYVEHPVPRESIFSGDWPAIDAALVACRDRLDFATGDETWRVS